LEIWRKTAVFFICILNYLSDVTTLALNSWILKELRHFTILFSLVGQTMEDLQQLEKLSLVNKIVSELNNHVGLNDKGVGK
jgi:hypothetical protein